MAGIVLDKLTKCYDEDCVVADVSLEIKNGEFFVFVGPSGSGKSTILRLIAGLINPTSGDIKFDQKSVITLDPREHNVAMVFQSYALYPHKNVYDNIAFGLRARKVHEGIVDKRVHEAATMLGVEPLLKRWPKDLSGGERQRVAIGRAIVRQPAVYLLDEPLSNLDARLRIEMRNEIAKIHKRLKTTFIYVTHDQIEAMTLGDKVVVMREGRIHQTDPPETIYDHPADTFVASFIGSPAMNLFKGNLIRAKKQLIFQSMDFSLNLQDIPSNFKDNTVEVGIRPEDIEVVHKPEHAFRAVVEMISNVGSEKYIHAHLGSTIVTVRATKEETFKPGETIHLVINPLKLHIFYKGKRI